MKIIALNTENRPNEISSKNWIVKNKEYTVIALLKSVITGEQFYKLKEVQPDSPYGGYKVNRFAIPIEELSRLCELYNINIADVPRIEEFIKKLVEVKELEEELI